MEVELLKTQGYCAGVINALKIVEKARLENTDKNIYIFGMLVHNQTVINELTSKGIITLNGNYEEIDKLNKDDIVIFTAHGHSDEIEAKILSKGIKIYDATCPIVKNNLLMIKKEIQDNHEVIYIGQDGHKETEAALSISKNVVLLDTKNQNSIKISDESPLVINQTTLNFASLEKIHNRILNEIPNARIENEICNATRLRQESIYSIDKNSDLIVIIGDKKSSNSCKLFEIAKELYTSSRVIMIQNLEEIKSLDLTKNKKATLASGASTPFELVILIRDYLLNYHR